MGFDIQPFGPGTVVVNGVPEGFSAEAGKVEVLVGDLLLILSDGHTSLQGVLENNLAEKFARAAAGGMREVTSPTEAGRLVDALMNTSNPEQTPSGKRILTFQSIVDIDKLF